MHKALYLLFLPLFLFFRCETQNLTPLEQSLEGSWQLDRTLAGYPIPGGPSSYPATTHQTLTFDMLKRHYSIRINNKLTEEGDFEVQLKNDAQDIRTDQIVFVKSQTYSTFSLSKDGTELYLYMRAPLGAILADGNTDVYKKVK